MSIYTLRTTSGREDIVADLIWTKAKNEKLDIKAILHPAELKGYLFIEGRLGDVHKSIYGLMHIKSLMEKPVTLSEIEHFLSTKKVKVNLGDVIEIIGGAFKGEKGKIIRYDEVKDEVTVELLEASTPIPVTISTELVKLIKKGKTEVVEEEEPEEKIPKKISMADLRKKFEGE